MANEVDICNLALVSLGAEVIRSFDPPENDKRSRVCKAAYVPTRDALLSSYYWTFARKTRELSLVDTDHPRWSYTYALPSDCWTPFYISERKLRDKWEVEGTHLLCNIEPVILRYVWRVVDPQIFSPHFVTALAASIKAVIAYSIVQDKAVLQDARKEAGYSLARAQEIDARIGNEYRTLGELPENDSFVNPELGEVYFGYGDTPIKT